MKSTSTPLLIAILICSSALVGTINLAAATTPVSVSITPAAASIDVGESIVFNSTLTGASIPYWYTWLLNGTTLSETGTSWTFTPSTRGTYSVYLIAYPSINDTAYNTAQSETAGVTVGGQSFIDVFGYSNGSSQASGSGTQYTVYGSRFLLNAESNLSSMSCLMLYHPMSCDLAQNYTYAFAIYEDHNGTVGNLVAQTTQGTMYYYDNNGPLWYTLDFPSVVHLQPAAYWLVEVHNASGDILVNSDVIDGYESVSSFISGMTFPESLPSPIITSNYVYCIYASWAVNTSVSPTPENNDSSTAPNSTVSPSVYNSKTTLPDVADASATLDGNPQDFKATFTGNPWVPYFVYTHSTHNVPIRMQANAVPELPTPLLVVILALTSAATAVYFKKRKR
jgi:hypothetical protein